MERKLNILIVDDDEGDRRQIRRALSRSGGSCECTDTRDFNEARAACLLREFDCVLLDYQLPGTDGLAAVSTLHEMYPFMAIIMSTGQGDEMIATDAMKRGACDYLPKAHLGVGSVWRAIENAVDRLDLQRQLARQRVELEHSLAMQTTLLKEVHHRVKNNLQIISSLLRMQADLLNEPKAAAALRDSQNRISSMALVHEQLYADQETGQVDFGHFCYTLVNSLLHSFNATSRDITARFQVSPVLLDADQAIPCGLILNELVTNAIKYAFKGGLPGEIVCTVEETRSGSVRLAVSDNGVGLEEGLDFANPTSLGLTLVNSLTEQLDGQVTVESIGGCMFSIVFQKQGRESDVRSGL